VAIVGAGFAGIGMAIQLRRAGFGPGDFVVLERGPEVGGTWRDNTYPGCRCDVPSHLYSYSFAPNPGWTRSFADQSEIWAYLRDCVDRFGVRPHLRVGTEVRRAAWDTGSRRWRLDTSAGPLTADALVAATGPLSEPAYPRLPDLDAFAGTTFHSARWNHRHDLTGRRVAVIGTGASAVQFVPAIQPRVAALHIYQRTAPWIVPRPDRELSRVERGLYRRAPALQKLARGRSYLAREALVPTFRHPRLADRLTRRVALRHLRRSVPDPALRARLTPDYTIGCKRVLLSDDYLPALTRPHVELITDPIVQVRPYGIVAADGTTRLADTIIFGTGFHVTDMAVGDIVRGADGRLLTEVWQGSPQAYAGTTVTGFPNLFLLLGPNTGLGHSSVVLMIEAQLRHVLDVLRLSYDNGNAPLAPTAAAQRAWVSEVDESARGTVWTAGGCRSWYLDSTGRNSTLWPRSVTAFRHRMSRFRPHDYEVPAHDSAPSPAAAA
jgi:cation diffusion facilitator CzcD-associated flavoprotein CzcO